MTTDTLRAPETSQRVALALGVTGAALVALACSFTWVFLIAGTLAVLLTAATENESFVLAMIFVVPFQWRLESGLPVASAMRGLFVLGFFLGRLVRAKVRGRELLQQSLSRWSLLFLAAGAASLIFGKPGWTTGAPEGIARLASYVGFYFVILLWVDTDERLRRVMEVIMVSAIFLAAFAFIQQIVGDYTSFWRILNPGVEEITSWQNRPPSFLDTPNNFAFYLNLILPIAVASWWLGDSRLKRLGLVAFCSAFVALFLTQSRGGLVALWLTLLLAVLGLVKGRRKQLVMVGGLCVVSFSLYFAGSVLSPEHLGGIEDTSSIGRLILWAAAWNIFANSPLFGAGLWNFQILYSEYFKISWLPPMILGTHNLYLQLLSETGIFGFLAFLGLIFKGVRNSIRLQHSFDPLSNLLGFAALWGLCSLLIHGFVEAPLENPSIGTLLWTLLALIAAKNRLDARRSELTEKLVPAV
jgi:hypothetical protein